MTMVRAVQIHADDNVATLLADSAAGEDVEIVGATVGILQSKQTTTLGHKLAVRPIAVGQPIIKFGVEIGTATADIPAGEWVHLHNIASSFDERSKSLDVQTGAVTDTRYG